MRTSLYLGLGILATLLSFAQPAAAGGGQKWALLVGVDRYESGDISPLAFAEADVHSMGTALIEAGGFPRDHVFVLTSGGKGRYHASRPNVVDWLVRLRANIAPGDTFVFFFAGHGISLEKQSFVLTTDALAQPVENLKLSALDVSVLASLLSQVPASRKLIMIDACRNDPSSGRGDADNPMKPTFARDLVLRPKLTKSGEDGVVATVFACHPGERSYEWSDKKHGFFSYFIIQGLRGAARTDKGVVTLPSLIDYLETSVPTQIRMWRPGAKQSPMVEISGSGAMRWVLAGTSAVGAVAPTPATAATPTAATPTADEPSVQPTPPAASPDSADVRSLLMKAQEAFDGGHFAEPAGDNAIEYARKARRLEPENTTARDILDRSAKAMENLAKQASSQGERARAQQIYERLFALFPDHEEYLREIQNIKTISISAVHFHDLRQVRAPDLFTSALYQNRGCWGTLKLSPQGIIFQASGGNDTPAVHTLNLPLADTHVQFGKFVKQGSINTDLAASGLNVTSIVKLTGAANAQFYLTDAAQAEFQTFNNEVLHLTVDEWDAQSTRQSKLRTK